MIKKIILSCFMCSVVSGVAFADGKSYVGGSLGVTNLGYTQYKGGKITAGPIGKLFGGYGYTFGENHKFYLGGELNLDLARYTNTHSNTNYALGASFIPGIMLTNNTMVYARLGVQANRFNDSGNSIQFGNQLGFGLQTKISKNWDVRAEYINVSNVATKHDSQLLLGLLYNFDF